MLVLFFVKKMFILNSERNNLNVKVPCQETFKKLDHPTLCTYILEQCVKTLGDCLISSARAPDVQKCAP